MMKWIVILMFCGALAACATAPRQQARQSEPPQIVLPPAPPPGEPTGLPGLQMDQLRVAFGTPAFVRKDGHSQMWRYDGASCKAFFFLFDVGNIPAVRHVETVPRGRDMAADENCLAALRAHPSTTPVS